MRATRTSIGRVMAGIALVGLNLGIWRAMATVPGVMGVTPLTLPALIALQVGTYLAFRVRGRGRWFWTGFVAIGSSGPMTILWSQFVTGTTPSGWAHRWLEFSIGGLFEWSRPIFTPHLGNPQVMLTITFVIYFASQCTLAIAGGSLALLIGRPCWRAVRAACTSGIDSEITGT